MTPDELEERIRDAMTGEHAALRPALWDQVIARRRQGQRVVLPLARPGRRLRVAIVTLTAAAVLLLVPFFEHREAGEAGGRRSVAPAMPNGPDDNLFLPGTLMAQSSSQPAYAPVAGRSGELRPGKWTYGTSRGDEPVRALFRYALARSEYEGRSAWLLTSSFASPDLGWRGKDSLWATIDSFRPLFRVGRAVNNGRIEQTYREHEVMIGTTQNGYTSWIVKPLRDTASDNRNGGLIRIPDFSLLLRTTPLAGGWKGSVPLPTESEGELASIWLNLAVDGEEVIEVPAGRFICWRIGLVQPNGTSPKYDPASPDDGIYIWISKDKQWLIQMAFVSPGKEVSKQVLMTGVEE